jgi:Ca2+-binding EF-hand superfamily protein
MSDSVWSSVTQLVCCSSARRPCESDEARAARERAMYEKLKAKLHLLCVQLDGYVEKEISNLFADADVDSSNEISAEEANHMVEQLQEHDFEFTIALRCFDTNRDGKFDKDEFARALRTALFDKPSNLDLLIGSSENIENSMKEAWMEAYDNADTLISVPEAARLMKEYLVVLGHDEDTDVELQKDNGLSSKDSFGDGTTTVDFVAQVGSFDGDGDGQLTRDEFFKVYAKFLAKVYLLPAPQEKKSQQSGIFKSGRSPKTPAQGEASF